MYRACVRINWVKESGIALAMPLCLFAVNAGTVFPEQKGNAPKTCQANDGVNDSAQQRILATEDPRHQVKLENTHQAPVQRADDAQDQSDSIQNSHRVSTSLSRPSANHAQAIFNISLTVAHKRKQGNFLHALPCFTEKEKCVIIYRRKKGGSKWS